MARLTLTFLLACCAACERSPSPKVFVDPALAVLIPQETTLLAGIRMERLRETEFYSEHIGNATRLRAFLQETGLDGKTDIWEFLIASDGSDTVVLLRGRFSEMGLEPRTNKPGAERISRRGATIIGDEKGAIAFLNPTTAIAGELGSVIQAVESRNESTGAPESLAKLVGEIPSTNTLWFASVGPVPGFLPVTEIERAAGGFDPMSGRQDLYVKTRSAEDAQRVAEATGGSVDGSDVRADGPLTAATLIWILGSAAAN